MLTQEQKDKIVELAAERDRALYAEEARLAAETAASRAANLVYWQPVLDAARAALPEWLTEGGRLEPKSPEADLDDRWVKLAAENNLYAGFIASVDLYDTHGDLLMTINLRRQPDAWIPETYHVIDGADYGRYSYTDLELALLRLPAEDENRRETRAAQEKCAAREAGDETTYAEYKAQEAARAAEIKAAQESETAHRLQFEEELLELMTAAETCISDAARVVEGKSYNLGNSSHQNTADAALVVQFSLAQSAIAIARILNDWRLTAREYARNPL